MERSEGQTPSSTVVVNQSNIIVVFAVAVGKMTKQTHPNIIVVENDNVPWPQFYNELIKARYGHILACLGNTVPSENYAEVVVDRYCKYGQAIGALYTDSNINYYSTFRPNVIINPPLAISGNIQGKLFDERLTTLYYYDALKKLIKNSIIYHVPKILITESQERQPVDNDIRTLGL